MKYFDPSGHSWPHFDVKKILQAQSSASLQAQQAFERSICDSGSETLALVGPLFSPNSRPACSSPILAQKLDFPLPYPTIFVDGGTKFEKVLAPISKLSVGDGDSYPAALDINLEANKDFTDLSFALCLIPKSIKQLLLLGFIGGRRDHELAVLGEIHQFLKHHEDKTQVIFDQIYLGFSPGSYTIELNGLFSILVLESTQLKMTGKCQFPLTDFTLMTPLSGLGISNHGEGMVNLTCHGPFFLIFGQGRVDDAASS